MKAKSTKCDSSEQDPTRGAVDGNVAASKSLYFVLFQMFEKTELWYMPDAGDAPTSIGLSGRTMGEQKILNMNFDM